MYADHTDLLAVLIHIVDGFAGSFGHGTHADDDALGIFGTVVAEEFVLAARNLADSLHVFLHDAGHGVVVAVADFAVGEECLRVLSHTAGFGMLGREGAAAEFGHLVHGHERTDVLLVHHFNLLVFVAGAEAVEKVNEGHAALKRCQVGNGREVHDFLYGAFAEHGKASLAASHHIAVVAKDTQRMGGERTGTHMEDAGQQFACNLVHIRYHEEQTLRSGERSGESTCLERTMNGTCCAAFALHFLYFHCVAEQVLATLC